MTRKATLKTLPISSFKCFCLYPHPKMSGLPELYIGTHHIIYMVLWFPSDIFGDRAERRLFTDNIQQNQRRSEQILL